MFRERFVSEDANSRSIRSDARSMAELTAEAGCVLFLSSGCARPGETLSGPATTICQDTKVAC